MDIELRRFPLSANGTIGQWYVDGQAICCTLELPWEDNKKDISCIPAGTYTLKHTYSPKFKRFTWEVLNVPNRTGIRLHTANEVSEIEGCIAPCMRLELRNGNFFGVNSKIALNKIESCLNVENSYIIKITGEE